jgi:NADH dehydrogenase [ubiquinone] 1 alpha subcomplex assembly factor 4
LKQVYVTSSHEVDQARLVNPSRPLPKSTEFVGYFELGYKESDTIESGRCSMKQAIQFIGDNKLHPDQWTIEKIAQEYKMQPEKVSDIIKHFKLFTLYTPEEGKEKERIAMLRMQDTKRFKELLAKSTGKILPMDEELQRNISSSTSNNKNEELKK